MQDEFYIGWEDRAPTRVARWLRGTVVGVLLGTVLLGFTLAVAQRQIGLATFEWGKVKPFTGILRTEPYPHLLVDRPGSTGGSASQSSYYLVKPFKFGFDRERLRALDGALVTLNGTLIYRGRQTMVEVLEDSIRKVSAGSHQPAPAPRSMPDSLGQQTLVGEIVDSKCYLGVMNPGEGTTHRACAVRCISGGIPPVLLVREANGRARYFLLVSTQGAPVNKELLDLVAEPVQITGEVLRQGDLLILRSDPSSYKRMERRAQH